MKMTLPISNKFIKIIWTYLEIQQIKFSPRNHHWIQAWPPDYFGIFCKPLRQYLCLNWKILPLSLPSVHYCCCVEFCWSLAQLRPTHNNQGKLGIQILGVIWSQKFLTAKTRFFCLCGMARCPVFRRWIFQPQPLDPGRHFQALDIGFRVESVGRWMKA